MERVKVLAQEHLPDGWTRWVVTTATKEEVFGEKIESNVLNKLVYALPTVGLARAFVPDADHHSERGYLVTPSSTSQNTRINALEQKMEGMLSLLLDKLGQREQLGSESEKELDYSDGDEETASDTSNSPSWKAPALKPYQDWQVEGVEKEFELLPKTKEADPFIPAPLEQLKSEGIKCQRLGTVSWNRIRCKEVEKHLHAASVFSALKVNSELGTLAQPRSWVTKQEEMLGTITHGLLMQRKALAEALSATIKKYPSASMELT